jgi:hypothetical protein
MYENVEYNLEKWAAPKLAKDAQFCQTFAIILPQFRQKTESKSTSPYATLTYT